MTVFHAGSAGAGRAPRQRLALLLRRLLVAPIRVYQLLISPMFGPRCRYYPSCSEYAAQAVLKYGPMRGLVLAGWRLLRCNPFSHGGFDPVDAQHIFKPRDVSAGRR